MSTERTWEQRGLYQHAPGVEWLRTVTKEGEPVDDVLTGDAYGRRSDGQSFLVAIKVSLAEYADETRMAAVLKEKFDLLDTFIDPRCECDYPQVCAWHKSDRPEQ